MFPKNSGKIFREIYCYFHRKFPAKISQLTTLVTGSNRSWHRVTSLIKHNALSLHHATNWKQCSGYLSSSCVFLQGLSGSLLLCRQWTHSCLRMTLPRLSTTTDKLPITGCCIADMLYCNWAIRQFRKQLASITAAKGGMLNATKSICPAKYLHIIIPKSLFLKIRLKCSNSRKKWIHWTKANTCSVKVRLTPTSVVIETFLKNRHQEQDFLSLGSRVRPWYSARDQEGLRSRDKDRDLVTK